MVSASDGFMKPSQPGVPAINCGPGGLARGEMGAGASADSAALRAQYAEKRGAGLTNSQIFDELVPAAPGLIINIISRLLLLLV